jgi:hypothetical protein
VGVFFLFLNAADSSISIYAYQYMKTHVMYLVDTCISSHQQSLLGNNKRAISSKD